MSDLDELVKKIEADGKITKDEIQQLNAALMEDGKLSSDERAVLHGLMAKLRRGELTEV